jgi:hypothetical protein
LARRRRRESSITRGKRNTNVGRRGTRLMNAWDAVYCLPWMLGSVHIALYAPILLVWGHSITTTRRGLSLVAPSLCLYSYTVHWNEDALCSVWKWDCYRYSDWSFWRPRVTKETDGSRRMRLMCFRRTLKF